MPITIYSVEWRQGNGHPIRHRTEGQAVQDEVAFDPFAMMDEQPDSAFTTVHLRPEPVHIYTRASGGELTLREPTKFGDSHETFADARQHDSPGDRVHWMLRISLANRRQAGCL